jgi:hypothetical protein
VKLLKAFARTTLVLAGIVCGSSSAPAAAQLDEDLVPSARKFDSAEHNVLELRIGPWQPEDNASFDRIFGDDDGLLLGLEFEVIAYRIENVLYLNGAAAIGWANYKGRAFDMTGGRATEESELELIPLSLLAVARLDAFARLLEVPFIVTGKLGYTWMSWSTDTGGSDSASGWSLGLAYAAQLALDLDSLDRAAARVLDEEWGINHTYLFFELHGFEPNDDSHPVGDLSWTAGLGFVM